MNWKNNKEILFVFTINARLLLSIIYVICLVVAQKVVNKGSFIVKGVTIRASLISQQNDMTVEISDIPPEVDDEDLSYILKKQVTNAEIDTVGQIIDGKVAVKMKTAAGMYIYSL